MQKNVKEPQTSSLNQGCAHPKRQNHKQLCAVVTCVELKKIP